MDELIVCLFCGNEGGASERKREKEREREREREREMNNSEHSFLGSHKAKSRNPWSNKILVSGNSVVVEG